MIQEMIMEHDEPILEKLTDVSVTFSEKPMVIFQLPLFKKFHWLELFPHIPKFLLAGFNYFVHPWHRRSVQLRRSRDLQVQRLHYQLESWKERHREDSQEEAKAQVQGIRAHRDEDCQER